MHRISRSSRGGGGGEAEQACQKLSKMTSGDMGKIKRSSIQALYCSVNTQYLPAGQPLAIYVPKLYASFVVVVHLGARKHSRIEPVGRSSDSDLLAGCMRLQTLEFQQILAINQLADRSGLA